MSGFVSALIRQRIEAKKAEPDTNRRFREILAVLRKYNYDDGITPEIVTNILQDLGPTFVKIGQISSQQSEYIPADYCEALAKLRSKVAPMDIGTVHAQIEKYLGKPANELFTFFDSKPLGSASVGQVHKAQLSDGTVVAVKVRRPGVVETVAQDFALIEKILDKFVKEGNLGGFDIRGFITELERTSKIELDFTNEANNLERFVSNNVGREKVSAPKCYRELTCEAVLTEEFVTGREVSDTAFLDTLDEDERERIAVLIADNFATQVLTDGFYHADPHSGNVFIKAPVQAEADTAAEAAETGERDGDAPAEQQVLLPEHGIEWIDFGMMGVLTAKQRQTLVNIVTCVVMHDAYGLKNAVLQVAKPVGDIDHGAILEMCESMCGEFTGADFGDFDLGDLLGTILSGLQDENFKVDPFLTNLVRGIIAVEGTVKTLNPKVNILNYFTSKVNTGMDFNLNLEHPEEMNPEIALKLVQLANGIIDSSVKSAEVLDMLEKGQVKVGTEFNFGDKALQTVNRIASYTIRALLIIGLIIACSLMCTTSALKGEGITAMTITFRGVGFIGFIICGFFAYRLYRDIKKGK